MTLIIDKARAASVPGRICSQRSDIAAVSDSRGSTVITFEPDFKASRKRKPISPSGFVWTGLWPQTRMQAGLVFP